ncbi:MAG: hypothetical protein AAGG75_13440 [Bacteroidota bacterium]
MLPENDPLKNKRSEEWAEDFNSEDIDQLYRSKFEHFEATPRPELWQKVQKNLPFSLLLRQHLYQLSKVAAAILLIMMMVGLLEEQLFTHRSHLAAECSDKSAGKANEVPKARMAEAPKEFVLDIEEAPVDKNIGRRLLDKEDPESIDELWAFITDDAEKFSDAFNEEKLQAILQPLEKLPAEGLAMVVPEKKVAPNSDESNDLTIMIPLKVVEDNEVEHLLNLYDQYQQNSKAVHKRSTE